jgi:heat shock protein HslJ
MKKVIPLLILLSTFTISCSKKNMSNSTKNVQDTSLTNTRWKLVKLPGMEIPPLQKDAFIQFDPIEKRALGSGGCNNIFGGYEQAGNALKFGPMGSTMMACPPEIMKVESAFAAALKETDNFIIAGDTLQLRKGDSILAELLTAKK